MKEHKKVNVALNGMRGSGKTTYGKLLAKELEWHFIDVDEYIEKKAGKKITDMVNTNGWTYFRTKEKEAIKKLAQQEKQVLGLGGGSLMDAENYEILKKNTLILYLKCPLKMCAERIQNETHRPSLLGKTDFLSELEEIWKERKERYEARNNLHIDVSEDIKTPKRFKQKTQEIVLKIKDFLKI